LLDGSAAESFVSTSPSASSTNTAGTTWGDWTFKISSTKAHTSSSLAVEFFCAADTHEWNESCAISDLAIVIKEVIEFIYRLKVLT
jgi:hypothetical protein